MKDIHSVWATRLQLGFLLFSCGLIAGSAAANPDLRFDVVTFCCNCGNSMLRQSQFNQLNFPSLNGHYIAMGSDTNRANLLSNGNLLAIYYNDFDADYSTNTTAAQEAAAINLYSTTLFTTTGPRPNWVVLNEISSGTWPTNQVYRTWVENVVQNLSTNYGYSVIVYSPFPNPGNNSADWQAVAANAYIAVENYLSGQEIQAQDFSVSWCQNIYQSSLTNYNELGVRTSQLILGEDFSQTLANTGYGRSGVSSNDWDSAINARSEAALNAGFAGFIGYAWNGDAMGVSTNEMVSYENIYAANPLPTSEVLTLPYPAQQPQNQIAAPGATVTFNVFPAGDAPITYQWSFNGKLLAGSTASALTLTNIGPTNGGTYAVLLSNAVGSAWSSNAVLTVAIPSPIAYEPFANATGSEGTTYTVAANLIGQTNAQGLTWAGAGTSNTYQPIIDSGNLIVPGLAFPAGNSVSYGLASGDTGDTARLGLGSAITTGTVYYSMILQVTSLGGLNTSAAGTGGAIVAGFNNSTGPLTSQPSVIAADLKLRTNTVAGGGGYCFGLDKSGTTSIWDATAHKVGDTVFVVGSYTFTGTPNSDVVSLWINPSSTTFGGANPPPSLLTQASGSGIQSAVIKSFLLRQGSALEPNLIVDELRIGASWASVTPPVGILPTLTIVKNGGNIVLSWPTNATGFNLYSSPRLSSSTTWTKVSSAVYVVGGEYTVTNSLPVGTEYFCLRLP